MTHLLHRIQSSHSQKRKVAWNKALAQHFDHTTNWKRTRGKAFFSGGCGFSRHKITNRATYRKDRKRPHASATPWSITTFLESPTSCNSCKSCEVRPSTCSGMQKSLRRQGWEICCGKEQMSWGKAFFFFFPSKLSCPSQTEKTDSWLLWGRGLRKEWSERLGLADVSCYVQKRYTTRSYCIAQRTIFNILTVVEKYFKKECIYMYTWITLLYSRN